MIDMAIHRHLRPAATETVSGYSDLHADEVGRVTQQKGQWIRLRRPVQQTAPASANVSAPRWGLCQLFLWRRSRMARREASDT